MGQLRLPLTLAKELALADPALARTIALHLCDLFVLALGATRDATVLAEGRGLRAGRPSSAMSPTTSASAG